MLCSICNKNQAVVFINKKDNNGQTKIEGYCYDCAKKQGINPISSLMSQANLSEKDLNDMTKQLESMVSDLTKNLDIDALSEQINNIDPEEFEDFDGNESPIQFGAAIPLGSIFSGMANKSDDDDGDLNNSSNSGEKKKVKVKKDKRKKELET